MTVKCSDTCSRIREWKKLLFLLIVAYMTFMVILYQGHVTFRGFFTDTTTPIRIFESSNVIHGSIRYIIYGANNTNESNSEQFLDIHIEHPELGHTGEVTGTEHGMTTRLYSVAIGGGLTSKKLSGVTEANIPKKFQVFTTLLPSFCKTASPNYQYHFYFAYDKTDKVFSNVKLIGAFQRHFQEYGKRLCGKLSAPIKVHFVQCSHTGSPAWAQNDAMMEAYMDGTDFFYRINDDSRMMSSDWTDAFVKTLSSYDPKYVGVVGPKHTGGNTVILTYDFVHRTHVDIFGFYYPRFFTTWWADDWVTKVYQPGRSTKLPGIKLAHTMQLGQRYKVDFSIRTKVDSQIQQDKKTLQRYIQATMKSGSQKADGTKVISFSLHGRNPDETMGAIRNAQLMKVYYAGWDMRVYVPDPSTKDPDWLVPPRIVNSLFRLGVQIAYVNITNNVIPPHLWSYLVADDDQVDTFLIRNVMSRFSDREVSAVGNWLDSGMIFHCMHDHPRHLNKSIVDGLWGAKAQPFRQVLQASIGMLLQAGSDDFLQTVLAPSMNNIMYCHDSVTCGKDSHDFPQNRIGKEYVGNQFNRHGLFMDNSHTEISNINNHCVETRKSNTIIQNTTTNISNSLKGKINASKALTVKIVTIKEPPSVKPSIKSKVKPTVTSGNGTLPTPTNSSSITINLVQAAVSTGQNQTKPGANQTNPPKSSPSQAESLSKPELNHIKSESFQNKPDTNQSRPESQSQPESLIIQGSHNKMESNSKQNSNQTKLDSDNGKQTKLDIQNQLETERKHQSKAESQRTPEATQNKLPESETKLKSPSQMDPQANVELNEPKVDATG